MRPLFWAGARVGAVKHTYTEMSFVLLEELVILLVEAHGVLAPELLRLVHGAPFQAAGLELGAVLVK